MEHSLHQKHKGTSRHFLFYTDAVAYHPHISCTRRRVVLLQFSTHPSLIDTADRQGDRSIDQLRLINELLLSRPLSNNLGWAFVSRSGRDLFRRRYHLSSSPI